MRIYFFIYKLLLSKILDIRRNSYTCKINAVGVKRKYCSFKSSCFQECRKNVFVLKLCVGGGGGGGGALSWNFKSVLECPEIL